MDRRSKSLVLSLSMVAALGFGISSGHAVTVMQQCGQQYQAAKAAGTLNGMNWNQYRTDCAAKLKADPAAASTATPATAPAAPAVQTANPLNPAPAAPPPAAAPVIPAPTKAATAGAPATGGRAAFIAREKQCGAEWRANKATLTTQTPGLTWPKYLSQCNTRLKAAGK
ncbi:hypothetical protein [Lichenifustis flavocetrariae]|uniref:Uncharacterized protein n=1 Tax=Lichenifustis flavocetrariae TaxID=2949735 RepID=A0AA41Z0Q7_9HYPH|nr:hypothetical protein [Lichenifustis flavocetrariae]MCW6507167.1 hypothetical protein [Lichenifustis flavocetrariae]